MEQPTTKEESRPQPLRHRILTREEIQRMNKEQEQKQSAPSPPNSDSDSNQ